jgi:hypothetical protein
MPFDPKETSRSFTLPEMKGKFTGKTYPQSTWTAKTMLAPLERIQIDRIRREILGGTNPQHADQEAYNIADFIANCQVRLVDSPTWWKDLGRGIEVKDMDVLAQVADAAVKVERDVLEEVSKEGDEAAKILAK